MRLLADQNVHRQVVMRLRAARHDVEFIQESMPGCSDHDILARTDIADFVLITGDKGFGRWIFDLGLPRPRAILYSRLAHPDWAETARRVLAILEAGVPAGHMITIAKDGERTKPFPIGASNG